MLQKALERRVLARGGVRRHVAPYVLRGVAERSRFHRCGQRAFDYLVERNGRPRALVLEQRPQGEVGCLVVFEHGVLVARPFAFEPAEAAVLAGAEDA